MILAPKAKGTGMNLGERQAYETGRKDGWQEAIVALASGAKKLLGPGLVATLADALRAGIAAQPKPKPDGDDPTEPASWDGRMPVSLATGMVEAHRALIPMESAPGVARDEAHRDFVHRALAMEPVRVADRASWWQVPADEGLGLICTERYRQLQAEGFDAAHDDAHGAGELSIAAACYAAAANDAVRGFTGGIKPSRWPFEPESWKPGRFEGGLVAAGGGPNPAIVPAAIGNLVKAGALIAAELDRLLRLQADQARRASTRAAMANDWHGTRPGDEDRHTVGEHR